METLEIKKIIILKNKEHKRKNTILWKYKQGEKDTVLNMREKILRLKWLVDNK